MSVYTLDYLCNCMATLNPMEQYLILYLLFLHLSPILVRFKDFILDKTLLIFQHRLHLRNIFYILKEYYGFYEQLQQFCQDASFRVPQPVHGTLEQVAPPPDKYAIEIQKQIKRAIQTFPPMEE